MFLNKNYLILSLLFVSLSATAKEDAIKGSIAVNKDNKSLSSLSKISLDEASKIALQKFQGKIVSSMLENEDGYLVYSVNIATQDHKIHEVIVDAGNGKVLGTNIEDGKPKDKGDGDGEEKDD